MLTNRKCNGQRKCLFNIPITPISSISLLVIGNRYGRNPQCIATSSGFRHFAEQFTVGVKLGSGRTPHRRASTVKWEGTLRKTSKGREMKLNPGRIVFICTPRLAAVLSLLIAALFAGVGSAKACGSPNKGSGPAMPWLEHQEDANWQPTIVGLWHTVYTESDGSVFNQTFKMWHSDGIEFENALLPPTGGNICYGVWRQTGHRTVKLHHIGVQ